MVLKKCFLDSLQCSDVKMYKGKDANLNLNKFRSKFCGIFEIYQLYYIARVYIVKKICNLQVHKHCKSSNVLVIFRYAYLLCIQICILCGRYLIAHYVLPTKNRHWLTLGLLGTLVIPSYFFKQLNKQVKMISSLTAKSNIQKYFKDRRKSNYTKYNHINSQYLAYLFGRMQICMHCSPEMHCTECRVRHSRIPSLGKQNVWHSHRWKRSNGQTRKFLVVS